MYLVTRRGEDGRIKRLHAFDSLDLARWHVADEIESYVPAGHVRMDLVETAYAIPPTGAEITLPDGSSFRVRQARIKEVRQRD